MKREEVPVPEQNEPDSRYPGVNGIYIAPKTSNVNGLFSISNHDAMVKRPRSLFDFALTTLRVLVVFFYRRVRIKAFNLTIYLLVILHPNLKR